MLVVGSRALTTFVKLDRVTHDWDIWMSSSEYKDFTWKFPNSHIKSTKSSHLHEINREIFEIKTEDMFDPSDRLIFERAYTKGRHSPIGTLVIPDIQTLFDIKASTAQVIDEPKHKYDTVLMLKSYPELKMNTALYEMRLQETQERFNKSTRVKYDFFHKYHIPEYIVHDYLHGVIAQCLQIGLPTYRRITTSDVEISEDLFNQLTHEQKISLMVEESLVLALERWFIPQNVENGINYKLIEKFYNNNEAMPTYSILKHCCITGLKGEKEYITGFGRNYFFEIEKAWIAAKSQIKTYGGFPAEFYDKLFKVREAYKLDPSKAVTI